MKYDLSKVPRPLHSRSLTCIARPTAKDWKIVVFSDSFNVVVAHSPGPWSAVNEIVEEIRNVLKAARVLAGNTTWIDDVR